MEHMEEVANEIEAMSNNRGFPRKINRSPYQGQWRSNQYRTTARYTGNDYNHNDAYSQRQNFGQQQNYNYGQSAINELRTSQQVGYVAQMAMDNRNSTPMQRQFN